MPVKKQKTRKPQFAHSQIEHGVILDILKAGEILVEIPGEPPQRMLCDFLQSATNNQLFLRRGDKVLVTPAMGPHEKGCVLGKVGAYANPETKQVVLEAEDELTLRCGDGFITIRQNGQILIKGLDIVSRAKRNNRIRGGSIQLN